ncbi:MAG TPA: tyrosine-protein phosphatase [Pyrinomonadaceae bacterium]|nr:tyrosine-protein phosphatase [Pyrinomonadaceae bacterium]
MCASTNHTRAQDADFDQKQSEALPRFARVNERLYRGAQPTTEGFKQLAQRGIDTVINLRDDDERALLEESQVKAAGLRYFNVPFNRRGPPTEAQVDQVLSLIDDKDNGVVFIHCQRGQDRTGMVVALHRISRDGWTDQEAIREAENRGMKFWHFRMKRYISGYFRNRARAHSKAAP